MEQKNNVEKRCSRIAFDGLSALRLIAIISARTGVGFKMSQKMNLLGKYHDRQCEKCNNGDLSCDRPKAIYRVI